MEPWRYSLAELWWRYKAVRLERWDQVAWICLNQPWMTKHPPTLEDFQPIRRGQRESVEKQLKRLGVEGAGLPKTLTEEEMAARWAAWKGRN